MQKDLLCLAKLSDEQYFTFPGSDIVLGRDSLRREYNTNNFVNCISYVIIIISKNKK